MKKMKKQLIELLNIVSPSGKEQIVVDYLKPRLVHVVDKMWKDDYGNLLAEKKVGTGQGSTVILSAHMDSVNRYEEGRKVVENNGTFTSTKGILGADDKAGLAIILAVLRNIDKTGFNGTIKVAFSREEEIGCVGSSKIDTGWIKGSDLAIVVDRRNTRDIVVGCFQAFCSNEVGNFFEDCSAILDMDWKATEGGISDATTFSELGVNSVNLSAGYQNEHTDKESLYFPAMKDTVNLILQALALVNDFAGTFGEVPESNNWVEGYSYGKYSGYNNYGYGTYFEDDYVDLWEGKETFGKVSASIYDGNVCISQVSGSGKNNDVTDEIFITRETFEKIVDAYYANTSSSAYSLYSDVGYYDEDELPFSTDISRDEEIYTKKQLR